MFSNKTKPKTKSFNDLSDDVLLYIFSNYFEFNTKLGALKVCKHWNQIIEVCFKIKRSLIITDYDFNESRIQSLNFTSNKISLIKMKSFYLNERTDIKDKKYIKGILKKYSNLESLFIALKYSKCNTNFIELISQFCNQKLQYLRIESIQNSVNNRKFFMKEQEIKQFCQKLTEIHYLYIDFVTLYMSENSLRYILTNCSNLKTLILHTPCFKGFVCNSETDQDFKLDFSGEALAHMKSEVTKVELPGNILSQQAIDRIPNSICVALKQLFIFKLNINSIERIVDKFSTLISFGFSIENNINELDLYALMHSIGKLRDLSKLYLAIISVVPVDKICIQYLKSCTQLKALQIDQTLVTKETINGIIEYLPSIENLELWTSGLNQNFHHCLTDNIIYGIKHLRDLRKLNFRGQRNISDNSIANIIKECNRLVTIDVRSTRIAIISLNICISRSMNSNHNIEIFVNETSISRLFQSQVKRYFICKHLILNNEEFDYKIDF